MTIYPSVLETDIQEFSSSLTHLTPHFNFFQLDIADGQLVSNTTVQIEHIAELLKEPAWDLTYSQFEFHLMVHDYESRLTLLETLNGMYVRRVLIHLKALTHSFQQLSDLTYLELGLVLNPEDDVEANWAKIEDFPTVQLMTIDPGFQGSTFKPETLEKIAQLRQKGYEGEIMLDGGINDQTLPIIMQKEFKPDVVCPGSYFKADDVKERLLTLQSLAGVAANEV